MNKRLTALRTWIAVVGALTAAGLPACTGTDSALSVSPATVTFTASEDAVLPTAVSVRVAYRGDGVLAGYAPGVEPPDWLSITPEVSVDGVAEFALQVTDDTVVGDRSTSVRFVTGHVDGTAIRTFDLPVSYSVARSVLVAQASPTALSFTAAVQGAIPATQAVNVTFNGTGIGVISAPTWLTVTLPGDAASSPAQVSVAVNSTAFAANTAMSGDIVLGTASANGRMQRMVTVHVDYKVVGFLVPEVDYVAPYLGIAGQGGTAHLRGGGFLNAGSSVNIRLGETNLGPLTPDNDRQVTLSYPPLPAGRYPVTLVDPPGAAPSAAELVIVALPELTYQAISAPSYRSRLVYDAERQTIYGVNQLDQEIERFLYTGGRWSVIAPRVVPELTDIAMTSDGHSLIVLSRDAINEISLADVTFTPVMRASNPDPFCGQFFSQAAATDSGQIFVSSDLAGCSGFAQVYLYNIGDHSLFDFDSLYDGTIAASGDGTRIYAGQANLSDQPVSIFESLSEMLTKSAIVDNVTSISVSGDASRVILDNQAVYSRSLTLTGNLPYGGAVLASRDSSRAFVYVEDAQDRRLDVYDLNGPLEAGALYPLLKTVKLADSPNGTAPFNRGVVMTSSLDDKVVFVSGDSKLLVIPVD